METFPFSITTSSPEETFSAGERLASFLKKGSVVALRGNLGAGKTCFTKGIAFALGIKEDITSPTYTIINEYEGEIPFYHIDAYRLSGDEDFNNIGAEELIYGNGISVIEWSENIPSSIPEDAIIVEIEITAENKRSIKIRSNTKDKK